MLDTDTKRRIDTARDILVGKVPDPKSQVEQITIALIYKFMDDMDSEAHELGGKRKFFTGQYARYAWSKLMRAGLGGHEILALYAEGIEKMPKNPGIPALFRDIFKNAYLPYRDPETLRAFLKIIDEFEYDHSERLGDAFEYLLSVLGSQGDAGQFRTPRHIIDFMVEVIQPKKHEVVLDPACGTAGFLISAYKYIVRTNVDAKGRSKLGPEDRARLAANFKGYDISPDMVRLSLVNLYLHGFSDPHVYEYDTLTQDERWNEMADVILANPPFMSPKGGIRPHNRFTIDAKRSEVLFVDYMAEHLSAKGRAGIIVPEGIIFQSQTAYRALRKLLVDNVLVAVVSLPAGCFNPYSGVKTSILIFDRPLAKKSDTIAFFKVENDGFGLGAQRRPIEKNDLPQVQAEIAAYLQALRDGEPVDALTLTTGHVVAKTKIAEGGEYGLSGERYREGASTSRLEWPLVPLGELCIIERGASPRPIHDFMTDAADGVNWIKIGDAEVGGKYITKTKERVTPEGASKSRRVKPGDFILSNSMSFGRPYIMAIEGCIHDGWLLLRDHSPNLDQDYLYHILGSDRVFEQFKRAATGGVVNNLNSEIVRGVKIPLPPYAVQKEVVAEIEGYQKVIDGARAVLENYRPHIPINPDWPMVRINEVAVVESGFGFPLNYQGKTDEEIPFLKVSDMNLSGNEKEIVYWNHSVSREDLRELKGEAYPKGTVIFPKIGAAIATNKKRILARESAYDNNVMGIIPSKDRLLPEFLHTYLLDFDLSQWASESQPPSMRKSTVEAHEMPLPSIPAQHAIVAEIEAEQVLVSANRELIARFEKKIKATLGRVWGEEAAATQEA